MIILFIWLLTWASEGFLQVPPPYSGSIMKGTSDNGEALKMLYMQHLLWLYKCIWWVIYSVIIKCYINHFPVFIYLIDILNRCLLFNYICNIDTPFLTILRQLLFILRILGNSANHLLVFCRKWLIEIVNLKSFDNHEKLQYVIRELYISCLRIEWTQHWWKYGCLGICYIILVYPKE